MPDMFVAESSAVPLQTKIRRIFSQPVVQIILVAAAYFVTARLSLFLAFAETNVSPVWPPSGLALACLFLLGPRIWRGIFVGAFLANSVVFYYNQIGSLTEICFISFLIAVGNTFEAILGYRLYKYYVPNSNPLFSTRDVFVFLGIAVAVCFVGAFNGLIWLCLLEYVPWELYHRIFFTWWTGDVTGLLTVMPLLWAFFPPQKLSMPNGIRSVQFLAFFIVIVMTNALVFGGEAGVSIAHWPLEFIIFPIMIWGSILFLRLGVAITTLVSAGYAIWGTLHGFGPFGHLPQNEALILVQTLIGMVSLTGMALAASRAERDSFLIHLEKIKEGFERVFEFSPITKILVDEQGKVEMFNRLAEMMLGYKRDEILGKDYTELIPETIRGQANISRSEFLSPSTPRFIGPGRNIYALSKEGVAIPIEISLNPINIEGEKCILSSLTDISLRKESERILKEREEQYRKIVNTALSGVISIDHQGLVIDWNPNAEKIFGWKIGEVYGKPLAQFIIPPEYRQAFIIGLRNFETKEYGAFFNKLIEFTGLNRAGKTFPIELSMVPIRIKNTQIFTAFVRDITESKNNELALKEREAHFRTMADHAPVMIWMAGTDAKCYFFNRSWLAFTGRTMEEEAGDGWANGVFPADLQRCLDIYTDSFAKREKFTMNYRLRRKDGVFRWVMDSGVPLYRFDGTFLGYIGSCMDITDLKDAQEILARDKQTLANLVDEGLKELMKTQVKLEQSNRLAGIGTLAATVAHELRNPLGVIQMASYNLKRKNKELENSKHLQNIEKKIFESNQIINNLLTYSSIKQPKFDLVNICELLEDCVQTVNDRSTKKKIPIRKDYPSGQVCMVDVDAIQFKEIFTNILMNACQAMEDRDGNITIRVKPADDTVQISVTDAGVGIEPDDLADIFQPFFTKKSKGTGLGLTICNELVHLHNGTIAIQSEVNKGTTVTVTLPGRKNNGSP